MLGCLQILRQFPALASARALPRAPWLGLLACALGLCGCRSFAPTKTSLRPEKLATEPLDASHTVPSNFRDWEPDQAVLPYAEISGDEVKVYNVRHCLYLNE